MTAKHGDSNGRQRFRTDELRVKFVPGSGNPEPAVVSMDPATRGR